MRFEPPLTYLVAGLESGERQVFEGTMKVYSASNPGMRLYPTKGSP